MALSDVGANIAASLLEQTGSDWTYSRGSVSGTFQLYKSDLPPEVVESGNGQVTEIIMVSFRGLAAMASRNSRTFAALFEKPAVGDRITNGTLTYQVQPIFDKCFYTVGGLIHIHAKKVAS